FSFLPRGGPTPGRLPFFFVGAPGAGAVGAAGAVSAAGGAGTLPGAGADGAVFALGSRFFFGSFAAGASAAGAGAPASADALSFFLAMVAQQLGLGFAPAGISQPVHVSRL